MFDDVVDNSVDDKLSNEFRFYYGSTQHVFVQHGVHNRIEALMLQTNKLIILVGYY